MHTPEELIAAAIRSHAYERLSDALEGSLAPAIAAFRSGLLERNVPVESADRLTERLTDRLVDRLLPEVDE